MYIYEFAYKGTVLYQFLETGTSDITFMGRDQGLKWLAFSLYPHSFFLFSSFKKCSWLGFGPGFESGSGSIFSRVDPESGFGSKWNGSEALFQRVNLIKFFHLVDKKYNLPLSPLLFAHHQYFHIFGHLPKYEHKKTNYPKHG